MSEDSAAAMTRETRRRITWRWTTNLVDVVPIWMLSRLGDEDGRVHLSAPVSAAL